MAKSAQTLASVVDESARDRAHRTIAVWATLRTERLRVAPVITSEMGSVVRSRWHIGSHRLRQQPFNPPNRSDVGRESSEKCSSSSTSSRYEPPDPSEQDLSEGYVSPAGTDGLGRVSELEHDQEVPSEGHLPVAEVSSRRGNCRNQVVLWI